MIETQERITMLHFQKKSLPKTSIVFDTYWRFAYERQNIFLKKMNNKENDLTLDSILNKYKFTNVYRASDRVSQYLISDVIYSGKYDDRDTLFRILLFKIFNKIETWKILELELGEISYRSFSYEKYDAILTKLLSEKKSIYSAAYIMASAKSCYGEIRKHQNHLKMIDEIIKDEVHLKLKDVLSMEQGYNLLLKYSSIGTFLAYQLITDINYSELTHFSEMEFVKAGPGAIEGIDKCFYDLGTYSREDIIRHVTENQDYHFDRLGLDFKTLYGRKLQLIDCQNIFCEVAKYARIAHPEFNLPNGRVRIKQKYNRSNTHLNYFYPPKWNINHLIH
ncbi:hypothetical protein D3C71_348960 [compost metagenome]